MDLTKIARTYREVKMTFKIKGHMKTIVKVVNDPSCYPMLERKNKKRRLAENIWWFVRHGETCDYYNSYGFDIKGFRKQSEYLPYRKFRIIRNNENYRVKAFAPFENKTLILRDKLLFTSFFGKRIGFQYVPEDIAFLQSDGMVEDFNTGKRAFLREYCNNRQQEDLFFKSYDGECENDIFLLEANSDVDSLVTDTKGRQFIVQKRITQHEGLNRINPSCLNTVRIITMVGNNDQKPHVFAHFLRLGINSIVDNRATGGIAVGIKENGELMSYGLSHSSGFDHHPVTGVMFDGFQIPYWKEVNKLVTDAHNCILNVRSIGWDVAITPDGPVIVEGNDNWEISGPQDTCGGMKKRWNMIRNL